MQQESASEGQEDRTVTRRQALKATGASSVALAGIGSLPTVLGRSGDTVEIVVTMEGDCIGETRDVSQQWYEHTQTARQAKRSLDEALSHRPDVHRIGLGRGREQIGGLTTHRLDVTISEDGTVDGIPDDVDGIPVNVDRSPRAVETACYYDDYDDIPGGAAYQCPEVNGTATLCCRVKDYRDGAWRTYMLGVRHNHMSDGDNCQDEDASQTSWEQFDTPAGEVEEGFQHHDAVLLELTDSSRSVSTAIADESGTVSGRVTSDGLDCLKSTNETVYKRGHANCKGSGTIEKTEEILECGWSTDYVGGVVRTTCEQNSGDSGGPVYYKDGSDLYIVNIATHRPGDGSHDAMGSSAESMNDKQGFWFGGDPYDGNCS